MDGADPTEIPIILIAPTQRNLKTIGVKSGVLSKECRYGISPQIAKALINALNHFVDLIIRRQFFNHKKNYG